MFRPGLGDDMGDDDFLNDYHKDYSRFTIKIDKRASYNFVALGAEWSAEYEHYNPIVHFFPINDNEFDLYPTSEDESDVNLFQH